MAGVKKSLVAYRDELRKNGIELDGKMLVDAYTTEFGAGSAKKITCSECKEEFDSTEDLDTHHEDKHVDAFPAFINRSSLLSRWFITGFATAKAH